MKRNNGMFAMIFLILGFVGSCDEIIVNNISDDTVVLTAPDDSIRTTVLSQIFSWETLPGASGYNITIQSRNGLAVDSMVTKAQFSIELDTGKYTWCVKAINPGYRTQNSCRTLEIYQNVDISGSEVELIAPADNSESSTLQHLFWWEEVKGASSYQLVIVSPNMIAPVSLSLDTTLTKNTFTHSLTAGDYQWCVRAINAEVKTPYSCRMLKILN